MPEDRERSGRMRIVTFNINGIKARLPLLLDWLKEDGPDVALLQELKCTDEAFPRLEIEDLGYNVATHGQKSFNGVAILSKRPIEDVVRGLPDDPDPEQARWIEATIPGERETVRVVSLYAPNGNPAPGPKFDYKLAWMAAAEARARAFLAEELRAVMAGDWNVIPEPRDAADPEKWREDALFRPETRAAFRRILWLGFHDAIRETNQSAGVYTFWDYQGGAWAKNDGVRIDHALLTPQAADRLVSARIEKEMRGSEKPSDHVPVWVELEV